MTGPTLRAGAWVLLDNLSAAVIAFGFFVVSARVLPPFEFGVAALVVSVAQMATPMIDSLFHDAIIQREDLTEEDVQTAFTASMIWAIVLAAAIILLSPAIAAATHAPPVSLYLPWTALIILSSGLMAVPSALARRSMEFRILAIRTISARTLATGLGLYLLVTGHGVWAVVAQAVVAQILSALFLVLAMRPSFRPMIETTRLKYLLQFASASMGTQILLFGSSRAFTLIMSGLLGPAAAGFWAVALRFVEPLQVMAATTLGQFTLPIYSRRQSDPQALQALFASGSRQSSLLLVPMFVGLGLCAYPLIALLVGEQWLAAAPLMAIICLVFAVIASRQLVEITLTSIGAPHLNLLIQLAAILLSLAGFAIGSGGGLLHATLGWALRAVPFVTLAAFFLRKRAHIPLRAQAAAIGPIFLASGVMAAAVIALQRLALGGHPALIVLIASVAVGVAVYFLMVMLLDRDARQDLKAVRRVFR